MKRFVLLNLILEKGKIQVVMYDKKKHFLWIESKRSFMFHYGFYLKHGLEKGDYDE